MLVFSIFSYTHTRFKLSNFKVFPDKKAEMEKGRKHSLYREMKKCWFSAFSPIPTLGSSYTTQLPHNTAF